MDAKKVINYLKDISKTTITFEENKFFSFRQKKGGIISAVDGSSIKLFDAYTFGIFARRIGYVVANNQQIIKRTVDDIKLDIIHSENYDSENDNRREQEEHSLAEQLNHNMVLIDGCSNTQKTNIVSISKKSSWHTEKTPLLYLIKKYGDKLLPNQCWYYEIDTGKYVIKLHPYTKFVFRTDYNGSTPEDVFGKLSTFCNDISCLGYPYPLAEIHKHVQITKDEGEYIKKSLVKKALENGMSLNDFENLFYDYHDYLKG
jgi:NurA-like 5'-3' nuclease